MADTVLYLRDENTNTYYALKLVDNGDSPTTYSLATATPAGAGDDVSILAPLGRKADTLSVSAALSTEDVATLNAILTQSDFDTKIGSLTETAPATDIASSGVNGRLQRISQNLTTLLTGIILAAGNNHIGEVAGNLIAISGVFVRPSDTNAYAVNDVVSDNTTTTTMVVLANAARVSGGSGYIVGLRIATNKKSITPRLRIHFFGNNGATIAGDNVNYKEVYADASKRIGYWDLPALTTAADTTNSDMSRSLDMTVRIPFTCTATSLYYVIETLDAFTPASGDSWTVTVYVDRN